MQKGVKTRLIIYEILKELINTSYSYDELLLKKLQGLELSQSDKNMIHSVILNSMRYSLHVENIVKLFVKKGITQKKFILLLGAITQIIFLNFKEYAVVNSTVEVAKIKSVSIYPGFINAVLKKIIIRKKELQKIDVSFDQLPKWFVSKTKNWDAVKKNLFLKNIIKTPRLHIVFKNNELLKKFNINHDVTSEKSITIKEYSLVKNILNYTNGDWWVQDYATMLPLYLSGNLKNKSVLDMCAAPGGKAFQAIASGGNVTLVDISKKRSGILKENLKRLKYNNDVTVTDILNIDCKTKYDYILLDAPCSAVGTIRRNPEIFYRRIHPNFASIIKLQTNLLKKSTELLRKNGTIIYMVCSFLKEETINQIDLFLNLNKNFRIEAFLSPDKNIKMLIDREGSLNTAPQEIENIRHDGFYAVKLKHYV